MIYIISTDYDESTSDVIEWLNSFKKEFKRINNMLEIDERLYIRLNNSITSKKIETTGGSVSKINSIWFRKSNKFLGVTDTSLSAHYKQESERIIEFVFNNFTGKVVGTPFRSINKLVVLEIAKQYGLVIPDTIITNKRDELERFAKLHKNIITKPVSEIFRVQTGNKSMISYTKIVTGALISKLPIMFPVSLFQQYIDKEYEIRIFYLDGKLYPMAIFSQNDKKTKIDFRRYNYSNPNRTIPYKLPEDITEKLIKFMQDKKMEASSIDMIKSNSGEYYFLEVNPWGQFGMVSGPCNYYLEKQIAEIL